MIYKWGGDFIGGNFPRGQFSQGGAFIGGNFPDTNVEGYKNLISLD